MKRAALDASAIMCFFGERSGAEEVEELIAQSFSGRVELFMCVVNWGEVYYARWRVSGRQAAAAAAAEIAQLPIEIVNTDMDLTKTAAELHANHKLPFADCFAAALARVRKATLITSDRDFAKVESEIEIIFI